MVPSADVVVSARSLVYRYPSADRPAVEGLDLDIRAGEYVALLGANGSGKSTLLKLIVGLLVPDSGTVLIGGESAPDKVRRIVSAVLQNPDDQIVATVVEEDVFFGPQNLGLPLAEVERRATAALRAVGLEALRRKPPHFLSGGERQRLSIAGALAMETPVLALDEAASMLDPAVREGILALLDRLVADGKTVLHVTHSMEDASRARRVVVLERGRIVFDGSPQELFGRTELETWGLESPQALLCARSLQERGVDFRPTRLDPEGFAEELALSLPSAARSVPVDAGGAVERSVGGPAVLRFENVGHTYLRGTAFSAVALRGVDLEARGGASLALVGPSGSGKSTLLRHGNAILLPQEGRAIVLGKDTLDPSVSLKKLRLRAALSVQSPETALFSRYVADDVAYGPRNKGLSGAALVAAVRSSMEAVDLPYETYRDRETVTLSGGEKRKAAVAGVLALDAELYLMDEPSAALDPRSRKNLLERLLALRDSGAALVATTHSMEEAARFDRVAVMKEGRLVAEGSPRDLFGARYDPSWGIALPWAAAAARALARRGVSLSFDPLDAVELACAVSGGARPSCPPVRNTTRGTPVPDGVPPFRGRKRRGAGIEFFRNAVIGQFMDRPSPIRNLSPQVKFVALAALFAAAILGPKIVVVLAVLAGTLALGAVARIGPRHLLRGALPALPYLALVALFQFAFSWPGDASAVLVRVGFFDVTADELRRSGFLFARFAAMLASISLFSAVTPLSEAVRGVESLLSPLRKLGLPARDLSMIAGIAMRFVPVLVEEAERIATAQLSRGGGYAGRGKVKAGLALTVPLFLRSLERAETLAAAMELRLYGASDT